MKQRNRFILVLCLVASIRSGDCLAASSEWTVMVYMNADSDLDKFALRDLNLMEQALYSSNKINVVVQVDRSQFGQWTTCRRYEIVHDNDPNNLSSKLLQEMGEVNMGDPSTLREFALWAIDNYPAARYSLVIYGHGAGYRGFSRDFSTDTSSDVGRMHLNASLATEMQKITTKLGRKIDHILFHSCLMGMFETLQFFAAYADYCNVSEGDLAGVGYTHFLSALNATPSMGAVDLGKHVINGTASPDTLSLIDMSKMGDVANNVNRLALALVRGREGGHERLIADTFDATLKFGNPNEFAYFIDLRDFAWRLDAAKATPPHIREAAWDVVTAVSKAVILTKNGPGFTSAGGISIYHCSPDGSDYDKIRYGKLDSTESSYWGDYLQRKGVPNYQVTTPRLTYWEAATKPTGLSGDDEFVSLELPFQFNLYGPDSMPGHPGPFGLKCTKVHVSTDGYLTFDEPVPGAVPSIIPDTSKPNAMIAGLWRDLVP